MKKKLMALALTCIMVLSLAACGGQKSETASSVSNTAKKGKSLNVVTTIFPLYDWTKYIIGNDTNVNLDLMIQNGVDLHSYQPTSDDIIKISTADVFIYVGGESDAWVTKALEQAVNKNMVVINLMDDVLKDRRQVEEDKEGMESDDEHDKEDGDDAHHDMVEYDEHIWLSVKNAKACASEIANVLATKDEENKDVYGKNYDAYAKELDVLDEDIQNALANKKTNTLIFADRFPFKYFVSDYNLDYFAAFKGCSAETEASFDTITFLAKKADEVNAKVLLTIDGGNSKLANTIKDNMKNKDVKIHTLNSLQSVDANDIKGGTSYIKAMKSNIDVLKECLN